MLFTAQRGTEEGSTAHGVRTGAAGSEVAPVTPNNGTPVDYGHRSVIHGLAKSCLGGAYRHFAKCTRQDLAKLAKACTRDVLHSVLTSD